MEDQIELTLICNKIKQCMVAIDSPKGEHDNLLKLIKAILFVHNILGPGG